MKLHHAITELMNKKYHLIEIDYRDDLSNSLEEIEEVIHSRNWDALDSIEFDDNNTWGINYAFEELNKEIKREFNVSLEKAEDFTEKYRDEIVDIIFDRDDSTPIKDMLGNTTNQVLYYDLSTDKLDNYLYHNYDDVSFKESYRTIKKCLGIKMRDKKWDKQIKTLIGESSYGGKVQIFFNDYIEEFMPDKNYKYITFKNPCVAVADRMNGSGFNESFVGLTLKLKLDYIKVRFDKNHPYSYTFDVCDMIASWCSRTVVILEEK